MADTPRDAAAPTFDPAQSAGLFVGVRQFANDPELAEVRYAVDDAVDLAFTLALDLEVRLLPPGRVKLALSGEPQKPESRQRLAALKRAGAQVVEATQANILELLETQALAAGRGGILVIAFATHGFSEEGSHYLLTASSLHRHRETMILAAKVFDLAARSGASRRLLFLDACRERLTGDTHAIGPDPRSAASRALVAAIAGARGQVIFSAAALGGYAYDDDRRRNGVFTAALLDGLHCKAPMDERGFVTVDTLARYVDDRVTAWRRQHRDPTADEGTETNRGGSAARMALATCSRRTSPAPQPASVTFAEGSLSVFDDSGLRIWGRELGGTIARAEVADLDGNGRKEVVVGVGAGGDDTGKLLVFSGAGEILWSADTTVPFNYTGGQSGKMAINTFVTGDLFRQGTRQIVALTIDAQSWFHSRLCIFDHDGKLLSSYWHPGHLRKVLIASPAPEAPPRIIVAGVNNNLYARFKVKGLIGVVFMLDPKDVRGEAPPYGGRSPHGTQLWYGVLLPENQEVTSLELTTRDGARQISAWTSNGYAFYLDFAGHVVSTARTDAAHGSSTFGLLGGQP